MNAETEQARPTLGMVREWQSAHENRTRDMLREAGLSMADAMRLVRAEKVAGTVCGLVALLKRDSRLQDAESEEEAGDNTAGLDAYLRGGVEDALDLLAMDLFGLISEVGTGDKS